MMSHRRQTRKNFQAHSLFFQHNHLRWGKNLHHRFKKTRRTSLLPCRFLSSQLNQQSQSRRFQVSLNQSSKHQLSQSWIRQSKILKMKSQSKNLNHRLAQRFKLHQNRHLVFAHVQYAERDMYMECINMAPTKSKQLPQILSAN